MQNLKYQGANPNSYARDHHFCSLTVSVYVKVPVEY